MVKYAFIVTCSFIVGALVVEYKQHLAHEVPVPIALLPDGGTYEGELRRGLLGGQGRISWPDESYYEGEFLDGLYHGNGILHTAEFLYEGEFAQGRAVGEGVIKFANGDTYKGEVDQSKPQGSGVLELADGGLYRGEFKQGLYHGQGELTNAKGDIYVGAFEDGLFHGDGVFTAPYPQKNKADKKEAEQPERKIIFSGSFVKGQLTGQGIWVDGERRYEGEFLDWRFNGQGLYSDPNGTYNGQFSKGLYEGQGVYTSTDGLVYEGAFVAGRYQGKGKLIDFQGDVYTGEFKYGLKHGAGVLVYAESLDGIEQVKGVWDAGRLVEANHPRLAVSNEELVEHALYYQNQLLTQQWQNLLEQDPDKIDLYFLGIAGDGSQAVFRREVDFVRGWFDENYATKGRSMILVNSPFSYEEKPLATVTSIEQSLNVLAEKMDKNKDILFVYLTSHGSRDFQLQLSQPGMDLASLEAKKLGEILKKIPVKHKVVVISACYSGGFIKHLKDKNSLLITAAEADKASFGCHDRAKMTYFGEAFFKDALPQSSSFSDAFDRARDIVRGREAKEGYEHSNPLIFKPKAIVTQLKAWREQLKSEQPAIPVLTKTAPEK